jgi:hypothetical protein
VQALVAEPPATDALPRAVEAFGAAGTALGRLADGLAADPQASCPPGQFLSTWKFILERKRLLQTTLMLAWMDTRYMHLFMIGDGGGCWRHYDLPGHGGKPLDTLLARCDLSTQEVQAVRPGTRPVRGGDFDVCCGMPVKPGQPFLAALHTDGLARGLGSNPLALLEELDRSQLGPHAENEARSYIEQVIADRPKDFADNLSLVVVRGTRLEHV